VIREALGIDTRFPDSKESNLPRLYKARAKRRAANKVARASRQRNRR
jgi:hypothetical protein